MQEHSSQSGAKKAGAMVLLTYLNVALLIIVLFVVNVVGEQRWWGTILTYMPQQPFIVPTILLMLIACLRKRWKILLLNLPAAAVCLVLLGVNIPMNRANSSGNPIHIMTWNVERLSGGLDRIIDTIKHEQADIVCLQEVSELQPMEESRSLRNGFPGWTMAKAGEVAILSRYPILRQRTYPSIGNRLILEAIVKVGGKSITVIAVHYSTSMTAESLGRRSSSLPEYMRQTAIARSVQTEKLLDIAAQSDSPVIIAGDFNTPPRGFTYNRIVNDYPDAFNSAGWGTGYTYPQKFPMMQIDHIFTRKTAGVRKCYTVRSTASDHLPIVAELLLPR